MVDVLVDIVEELTVSLESAETGFLSLMVLVLLCHFFYLPRKSGSLIRR